MDSSVTNYNKCIPVPTRITCDRARAHTRTRTRRQLPDDCWCSIFEKLDNKSDRTAFGLTCQSFLAIERSTCKHLHPKHDKITHGGLSFILNMLNRSFRQLESLSLYGYVDLLDSSLTSLLKYGSKIHSLNLTHCFRVTDKGLSYVASSCPALSSISLYRCCGISDYGLLTLSQSCKSLKRVDLSFCSKITDLGISYLNQNCLKLDTLWISGCIEILGESFLGFSPTLARLDASNTCGITFLDLWNCGLINNDAIEKISKGCPLLQEWNLSRCSKITILGWESIRSHCQNLKILHVNYCEGLCLEGLLALGNGCKHLSVLYMNFKRSWIDAFKTERPDVQIIKAEAACRYPTIKGCFW